MALKVVKRSAIHGWYWPDSKQPKGSPKERSPVMSKRVKLNHSVMSTMAV